MDRQNLDRLAYAGVELPACLGYADALYFLMLRALYAQAKRTDMTAEQGRREKAKIEEAVRTFRADEQTARYRAEQMKTTGRARSDYRKARKEFPAEFAPDDPEPTAEAIRAADKLVEALDNMPIGRKNYGLVRSTSDDGKASENAEACAAAEG